MLKTDAFVRENFSTKAASDCSAMPCIEFTVTCDRPDKIKISTGLVVTCDLQKNQQMVSSLAIICAQKCSNLFIICTKN